ncbi:hypothetical protein [Cryobacterium sp. GrIS_2_6]|uniref:hypothetical protein n=1 Tax=Cryobacterium sp. GrIS_2_6 TaxID=3162785 RepID=UPI002E0B6AD3|nr:hypothetical protein [Cryobacterium psychrotolerans]
MADAPPELSVFFGLANLPDIEQVPQPLRGQTIASAEVVFVGTAEDAAPLLAPLLESAPVLADETRPFTIGHLAEVAAEPTEPAATIKWTAAITSFAGGDEAGLGALARAFQEATPAGLTVLALRALGVAIAEQGADAAAVAGRLDARFLAFAGSFLGSTARRPGGRVRAAPPGARGEDPRPDAPDLPHRRPGSDIQFPAGFARAPHGGQGPARSRRDLHEQPATRPREHRGFRHGLSRRSSVPAMPKE